MEIITSGVPGCLSRPKKMRQQDSHVTEAEMERALGFRPRRRPYGGDAIRSTNILVDAILVFISVPRRQAHVVADAGYANPIKSTAPYATG